MINYKLQSRGFSIIELLVVIAIIGFIGSIIFVQLQQSRARARDAEREQEIKSLQNALSLYVVNRRNYPVWSSNPTTFQTLTCSVSDQIFSLLIAENSLPGPLCDPQNASPYLYEYRTSDADGFSYELRYSLETNSISGKAPGQHTATP